VRRGIAVTSEHRRRFARLLVAALAIVLAAGAAGADLAARGGPAHDGAARHRGHPRDRTRRSRRRPGTTEPTPVPTTAAAAATTTTSPGTLPQTRTLPPATSPQFEAAMQDLWDAVVTDDVTAALPAFFPERAYEQVKAIGDAATDYLDRLVAELRVDVAAAHGLLGTDAATAQLVTVDVPEQYAHWVTPGVCFNAVGYWEVPNARVVYRVDGAERSFGIASLISWRGMWYVVHLGAVVRPTTTARGLVDDPSTGPGVSAYSSTC
jgi:hypothetical protein